jgi:hypothetical protein
LFFPPFQIFNFAAPWVGTFWLEEVLFIYILAFLGVVAMAKQKQGVAVWYGSVFLLALIFVSHRDILRYALPIFPFLLVAWSDTLAKKEIKWLGLLLLIPIYLYSLAFISQNVMPVSNWSGLL